jgi:hypothetical protein
MMSGRRSENTMKIGVYISATDMTRLKIAGSIGRGGYSKFVRRAIRKLLDEEGVTDDGSHMLPAEINPTGTPNRRLTLHAQAFREAHADAANRLPVLISFPRKSDHNPHGILSRLKDNGLRRRGDYEWVGRLLPAACEDMERAVARLGATFQITGALGEVPLWKRITRVRPSITRQRLDPHYGAADDWIGSE